MKIEETHKKVVGINSDDVGGAFVKFNGATEKLELFILTYANEEICLDIETLLFLASTAFITKDNN